MGYTWMPHGSWRFYAFCSICGRGIPFGSFAPGFPSSTLPLFPCYLLIFADLGTFTLRPFTTESLRQHAPLREVRLYFFFYVPFFSVFVLPCYSHYFPIYLLHVNLHPFLLVHPNQVPNGTLKCTTIHTLALSSFPSLPSHDAHTTLA